MTDFDRILKSVDKIPAFPGTVQKVIELMSNPDYSTAHLTSVIEYDPSITANVLKMCNSAFFGSRHRITSIRDAVMLMGQENILRVVNIAGIANYYKKAQGYGIGAADLWKHSVASAIMSQILLGKMHGLHDQALFTAVLLHDIGKIVLSEFVKESYQKISALVTTQGYSFLKAEQEILGINHAEIGGG